MFAFTLFLIGVAAGGVLVWFALRYTTTDAVRVDGGHNGPDWSAMSIVARVEAENRQARTAAGTGGVRSVPGLQIMASVS
ncbi:hypothetical protein [Nocardia sp. NBC_01388]|uniref:hypothetical protein n=1 Tax=Nocardia sp. NBC_01388 TaxID=2903596 RepID=UPI00324EC79D